jgi:gamma-glutamyltranspeptidase/glutathione hydrolase
MDDFTAKLGVPNIYGPGPGRGERDRAGKRPLSSMSPTIVTKDGKPVMVRRHAGRQPHHHRGAAHDHQRHRLRHDGAGGGRRAALPPAVAAQPDQRRGFAISPDTRKILEGMGHVFAAPQPANHVAAILVGAPSLAASRWQEPLLRRQRPAQENMRLALGY